VADGDVDLEEDGEDPPRISTGSAGLDNILGGGIDADRLYLYEGRPGTGKTTIALQFLLEGARQGERVLYITLSETQKELRLVARRHGWSLSGIECRRGLGAGLVMSAGGVSGGSQLPLISLNERIERCRRDPQFGGNRPTGIMWIGMTASLSPLAEAIP
jgi:hypothetical protein